MKIIIQLSDANDYLKRIKNVNTDIFFLIIREENSKVTLKNAYRLQTEVSKEYLSYMISQSEKINVEIIGHSSTGGKQIQADKTEKYPNLHFICIDKLALWLEDELLKNNMNRCTISLLSCQAARGTSKFPALGAQLFELFKQKPEKLTARHGYVFIEGSIYSLGGFDTVLKVLTNRYYHEYVSLTFWQKPIYTLLGLVNKIYQHSKTTPMKEKVAYFEGMDNETRIIDKHLYDAHKIIKRKIIEF
ncbi:MAG: hypothetical protein HYX60_03955, partial [Legionella longbeachae]|nr:hypothetical protein [Legionella longbeachae]